MTIEAMKLALDALELWSPALGHALNKRAEAVVALRAAIEQAEKQEPVAWVYPEGLEALKSAKPWVAYGSNGDGPHSDGVQRIPLYLNNDAVAPRVEPRASESGAGFESLPASPNQPEPEPEPEPVVYMYPVDFEGIQKTQTHAEVMTKKFANLEICIPLYTAPRQWQGLTKREVDAWDLPERPTVFEFAQFVEAKLKEKNG